MADRGGEIRDEVAGLVQGLEPDHPVDGPMDLGDPPGQLDPQPFGVLFEGGVDGVGVEEQMDAALADLEESVRVQHGWTYRQAPAGG